MNPGETRTSSLAELIKLRGQRAAANWPFWVQTKKYIYVSYFETIVLGYWGRLFALMILNLFTEQSKCLSSGFYFQQRDQTSLLSSRRKSQRKNSRWTLWCFSFLQMYVLFVQQALVSLSSRFCWTCSDRCLVLPCTKRGIDFKVWVIQNRVLPT